MFLPVTREEMRSLGWDVLDVILVTGDAYIDHPAMGTALVGRVLQAAGFRVGIIAQPDIASPDDISRLGEPRLFWGVSGGAVDSMVANYTAVGKRRKRDDFTPGGVNDRRPDRAVIAYSNLIRRYCKGTAPIVLGGIEASLRRIAHYDWWGNAVRRSILFDAKADLLLYGMADETVVELAESLRDGRDWRSLRGLCFIGRQVEEDAEPLPSFEEVARDPAAFFRMFSAFYRNNDPLRGRRLVQQHGDRWLIHNPPPLPLGEATLDRIHELPFRRDLHPWHARAGKVRALDTVRFSLTTHRGCYGECNFCAIAVHQGRTIQSRSIGSLLREAGSFAAHPAFKGIISDVGGATANMYGRDCPVKIGKGACAGRRCLYPEPCPQLPVDHRPQLELLRRLRQLPGVKKVFIGSGIRYDMVLADRESGRAYLEEVVRHHVSGQLKIAPEHADPAVLALMGKPGVEGLLAFRDLYFTLCRSAGREQYLTYYFIAAHPGCGQEEMERLRRFCGRELRLFPEQVQIFTPTPATWSTTMYHTGLDYRDGRKISVEKNGQARQRQKEALLPRPATEGRRR
ncbi:MAG: YgiQ family radical SAM protein [Thermodesulfobacteriota bacterium]